ncbi:MAG: 2,3-bisphosphoglycerate-dependent phosphoglycerate mutase [Hyphomicrobiaceae bacterium]
MATLVLVRHGQSQWNLENRFTGWEDVPLTELGRDEAQRAGVALAAENVHFDTAYTSLLKRAQDTLAIMLDKLGQADLPIVRDEALNERHYGSLQGLNKAETAKKYGAEQVHIWRRSYDIPPPDGESLKDTAARTLPYFNRLIASDVKAGKNIIVAAHGNSLRSIVMELDQLSQAQVLKLNIATGIPIIYDIAPDGSIRSKKMLEP